MNASVHPRVDKQANHYVFAVASFRYLRDNLLTDTAQNIFNRESAMDIGFRVGYERKDLAVSIEHVRRSYNGSAGQDSKRTVGILQYRVSRSLFLFGTFGKNFGVKDNLFTMLGVNWGWGGRSWHMVMKNRKIYGLQGIRGKCLYLSTCSTKLTLC